ncbi:MAG: endonuclease VIII [Tannerellaceae bacterium]|nr:endonuclease VIII [Tannerellaceae bacterium]
MLEAPEALYLANQINDTLRGKRIILAVTGYTPHKFTFYSGDTAQYEERLLTRSICEANARGGMLEIRADDTLLVFSDGANLRYYGPGAKLPPKYQMLLGFDDDSFLVVSIRMYGGIWCMPVNWRAEEYFFTMNLSAYYETACNKPQVLSAAFTKEYFMRLAQPEEIQKKSAKGFLATGQSIPGLGNGVLQDILYDARIHPKKKVKDLTPEEVEQLYHSIKKILNEIYLHKGRNMKSDLFGNKGEYIPYLSKDTTGKECTRCGDIIQKESYLGGSIYYCPGCQKLLPS